MYENMFSNLHIEILHVLLGIWFFHMKMSIALIFEITSAISIGAYLNIIQKTAKFLCPADFIPPYIDVDLSELDLGQKLVMGDLKVHPALKLLKPEDMPVCKVMGVRVSDQKKK